MNWMIDVRDVARAHIRAAELPSAKGRYLISVEMTTTPREVSDLLSARFPEYEFPQLDEAEKFRRSDSSKVRARNLVYFRPLSSPSPACCRPM